MKFKKIVNDKIIKAAFMYLEDKRGSKGKEIVYKELKISEYLLPSLGFSLNNQRKIFSIRNRTVNIPFNLSKKQKV